MAAGMLVSGTAYRRERGQEEVRGRTAARGTVQQKERQGNQSQSRDMGAIAIDYGCVQASGVP